MAKKNKKSILDKLYDVVQNLLNYTDDQESSEIIFQDVMNGAKLSGPNLIILLSAAVIASAGLNVNSTAVIIGAMLISPLMGPIIALGYGLAIYNRKVIKLGLTNLGKSIGIALLASIVFFFISPIVIPSDEIISRTSVTPYDLIIAFFGGVAGIIGITRTQKTNVIPGVAIATALMPPLCTVGFGIANGDWDIIFGASYLFFINIFFITLSTFLIVKVMGLEYSQRENYIQRKSKRSYVIIAILIVSLPSFYSAVSIFIKTQAAYDVRQINEKLEEDGTRTVVNTDISTSDEVITFTYYGEQVSTNEKEEIRSEVNEISLNRYEIDYVRIDEQELIKSIITNNDTFTTDF